MPPSIFILFCTSFLLLFSFSVESSLVSSVGLAPIEDRVAALVAQMNISEKIGQLFYGGYSGNMSEYPYGVGGLASPPVASRNSLQSAFLAASRLKIPVSFYQETLRSAALDGSTAFPMPALLGSSWNITLLEAVGRVVATEASAQGIDRSFSPVLQVTIDPRWGRFPENYGEIPGLVGALGAAMTRGLLGPGNGGGPSTYLEGEFSLIAFAKHALAYGSSSTDGYDGDMSERKLYDVFLRPWREFAAVGGRGAMVSHEALNFVPMHANGPMLRGVLRGLLNMTHALLGSDNLNVEWLSEAFHYSANNSRAAIDAITASVDQEMSGVSSSFYYKYLPAAVASGAVSETILDEAVSNVLRAKFAAGLFENPFLNESLAPLYVHTPDHVALAREAAQQGIVLLTNANSVLPLPSPFPMAFSRIAIIGPNGGGCNSSDLYAACEARTNAMGGYGVSPTSLPIYTLEDAVRAAVGGGVMTAAAAFSTSASSPTITYARGADIDGPGAAQTNLTQYNEAVQLARDASDVVFLVLGDSACFSGFGQCTCGEGADRTSLDLPGSQQVLLMGILNATGNLFGAPLPPALAVLGASIYERPGGPIPLVVVLIHGRTVTFDAANFNWLLPGANPASKAALLSAWLPAEQGGLAILDVLSGAVNPAGKTIHSWVRSAGHVRGPSSPSWQQPNSQGTGPFFPPRDPQDAWSPLFPIAYGLSYTTFQLSNLSASATTVTIDPTWPLTRVLLNLSVSITNTGALPGAEFIAVWFNVQPEGTLRYVRALAAFTKVFVPVGATVPVTLPIRVADLDRWSTTSTNWVLDAGNVAFSVATCWNSGGLYNNELPCDMLQAQVLFLSSLQTE